MVGKCIFFCGIFRDSIRYHSGRYLKEGTSDSGTRSSGGSYFGVRHYLVTSCVDRQNGNMLLNQSNLPSITNCNGSRPDHGKCQLKTFLKIFLQLYCSKCLSFLYCKYISLKICALKHSLKQPSVLII